MKFGTLINTLHEQDKTNNVLPGPSYNPSVQLEGALPVLELYFHPLPTFCRLC